MPDETQNPSSKESLLKFQEEAEEKRTVLENIISTASKIIKKYGDTLGAREVNENYAHIGFNVNTKKGPAKIMIGVYRGKQGQGDNMKSRLDGEVYIRSTEMDDKNRFPIWRHRTQITTGTPGPHTDPLEVAVVDGLFLDRSYIEDNFAETTIPAKEALEILQDALEHDIPDSTDEKNQPYNNLRDKSESNGSVLGDLGVFF